MGLLLNCYAAERHQNCTGFIDKRQLFLKGCVRTMSAELYNVRQLLTQAKSCIAFGVRHLSAAHNMEAVSDSCARCVRAIIEYFLR